MEGEKHLAGGIESDGQLANVIQEETFQTDEWHVNASGHVQELDRKFGFWSLLGTGIITDNAWAAGGVTLVVSLYNGGGPGVIWEL